MGFLKNIIQILFQYSLKTCYQNIKKRKTSLRHSITFWVVHELESRRVSWHLRLYLPLYQDLKGLSILKKRNNWRVHSHILENTHKQSIVPQRYLQFRMWQLGYIKARIKLLDRPLTKVVVSQTKPDRGQKSHRGVIKPLKGNYL